MGLQAVMKRAVTAVPAAALAFSAATLSTQANALEIGCATTPEQITALKTKMLPDNENQIPVMKFFSTGKALGDTKDRIWQDTITMNPQTRTGHRLSKDEAGNLCVISKITEMQVFDNSRAEPALSSYVTAPGANAEKTGINRFIHAAAKSTKELPMVRGIENTPGLKRTVLTYIVANPKTGAGTEFSADLQGSLISAYTRAIPAADPPKIAHGAVYTDAGKEMFENMRPK